MIDFYKSVFMTSLVRVFSAVIAFLLTLFITRELGAEEAGYYFLAFSFVAILSAFSRLGMDNTVVRFVAEDNNQIKSIIKIVIIFKFLSFGRK